MTTTHVRPLRNAWCGAELAAFVGRVRCLLRTLAHGVARLLAPSRREAGARLGAYVLRQPLGEGAAGEVWAAVHWLSRRPVALKLAKLDAKAPAASRCGLGARMALAGRIAARFSGPHVPRVEGGGRLLDGTPYLAMELIEGRTLAAHARAEGPLEPGRARAILRSVAEGLADLHRAGVVHRDIKPANLILRADRPEPTVTLLDFGLARDLGDPEPTDAGSVCGTPAFLAPEAITGGAVAGTEADVYALGAVAFVLLTGTVPFRGRTAVEVLAKSVADPPPPLPPTVPRRLAGLVSACLAKRPQDRPSAASIVRALGREEDAEGSPGRPALVA
ncbi:MAG: serine/threonine-protein kinase [Sandaracinaceae bacterium]